MKVKHKSATLQQYLSSTLTPTDFVLLIINSRNPTTYAPASSYTGFCASIRIALPQLYDESLTTYPSSCLHVSHEVLVLETDVVSQYRSSDAAALRFMHTHLLYMDESFCALTPPVLPYHFKLTCILIIDKRLFTLFHAFLQLWRTALLVFLRAFYKKALFITFHC
jgi:hypothetical protein